MNCGIFRDKICLAGDFLVFSAMDEIWKAQIEIPPTPAERGFILGLKSQNNCTPFLKNLKPTNQNSPHPAERGSY